MSLVLAKNHTNKYHKLQVNLEIIDNHDPKALEKLTNTIKSDLLIFQATQEIKLTQDRILNLHIRTEKEILEILQSLGYYHSKVIKSSLNSIEANKWLATYKIFLGDPTKIKIIDIKIINDLPIILNNQLNYLISKNLKVDNQLNHAIYEKTKQLILNTLRDQGFLGAEIKDAKIMVDLKEYTAKILIIINPKQQYYLGEVKFRSDQYSQDFLENYIPFKKMDLYSTAKLMQLKNNLLNSELFSKVRIDTTDLSKLETEKVVPIIARVYPKPANKYVASIGFGTDTGFRGKIGSTHKLNFKPGDKLSISFAVTKPRQKAIIDYGLLGKDPLTQKYNLGLIAQKGKIKNRSNKNLEAYWKKSLTKDFKQSTFKISFLHETFKELPNTNKKNAHFLLPSIKTTWLALMEPKHHDPLKDNSYKDEENSNIIFGNKTSINLKCGLKAMLSSSNMLQLTVENKSVYPFIFDTRLIFKAQGGTTLIKDLQKLPISLRFFAGGDHSIRGFSYNNLGPVAQDLNNEYGVIGGKHLLFSSLQLEKPIPKYKDLSVAMFIDAGNAVNNLNKFINKQLAVGSGIGMAYNTPIGALKAYLAKPIKIPRSNYNYKKHLRIHLTFVTDL